MYWGIMTQDAGMPSPTTQVFRREGEYWTLGFAGVVCRMRDTTGLHDIAYLLRQPNCRIETLDIVCARNQGFATQWGMDDSVTRERARVNVTRSIAAAMKRITVHHPMLAIHLKGTIRTGHHCIYTPDPRLPLSWEM